MAKIDSYNLESPINNADTLIGTNGVAGTDFGKTKEFQLIDIKNYINSYKVWFVQTMIVDGVIEEVLKTFENTIGNLVYSPGASGSTKLTLAGAFTDINKIVVFSNGVPGTPILTHTVDYINVPTTNFIEVRVYN
jgi:hypothetical protein